MATDPRELDEHGIFDWNKGIRVAVDPAIDAQLDRIEAMLTVLMERTERLQMDREGRLKLAPVVPDA